MRKIFLVTGFNNWGKTHIIKAIFDQEAFSRSMLHPLPDTAYNFMVQPYSNDDLGLLGYCEQYYERIGMLNNLGHTPKYMVSAFCPTRESQRRIRNGPKNQTSINIISELYGEDNVHILLLQHKWCGHAELHPNDITAFYAGLKNVTVTTITSETYSIRLKELNAAIRRVLVEA
jgi:hypothetical protein